MHSATLFADKNNLALSSRKHFLFVLFLLMGCNSVVFAGTRNNTTRPVIDVATLQSRLALAQPDMVLVDVRDSDTYRRGHLPGAVNLPVEHTFNLKGDHTRIASLEQIRELMSNAGIRNSDYLVLYDDGKLKDAAHVFWVLETYGHKQLSVLEGGLAAWNRQHGELTTTETARPRTQYLPSIATRHLSTELAVLLATRNPNVEIIDARDHREYMGLSSQAKRKGHIPNAISIPWDQNLALNSQVPVLKSRQALRALYGGLDKKDRVITYCNRGKESAVTYLVLRNLGYKVSVYDGAWLEWGDDDQLPIERGTELSGYSPHER